MDDHSDLSLLRKAKQFFDVQLEFFRCGVRNPQFDNCLKKSLLPVKCDQPNVTVGGSSWLGILSSAYLFSSFSRPCFLSLSNFFTLSLFYLFRHLSLSPSPLPPSLPPSLSPPLMCVCVYIYTCIILGRDPQKPKASDFLALRVKDDCELECRCWYLSSSSLLKQYTL